ncbi:serine hydrolase [Paenibacillus xanthanilyticus]|uniref:Serine hydrolase n=1 Tax=Paenibacillus xanthanilyticus TaxID=1783531 RepID=A0ABV8KDS7_9BACL
MSATRRRRSVRLLTAALIVTLSLEAGALAATAAPHAAPLAAAASSAAASASLGPKDAKEVEAFLDAFFAQESVKAKASGVAVSIVKDGKLLASKGYGIADKASGTKVDPEKTVFRIASVSKICTATAVMQLVEQGKISLTDNIEKHLGGYKVVNPFGKPVTIEMLLTHTTGFEVREPTADNILNDPAAKPRTLEEQVKLVFPPVVREPGTSYMYDNFASSLQGYIVEKVSGEPFETYMQKHIFKPLGMTSSSFVQPKELEERLASAYDAEGKLLPLIYLSPREIPEGSMLSTASDMSKFMNAFLTGGKAPGGTVILTPASIAAMSVYRSSIHKQVLDTTYGFEAPSVPGGTNGQHVIIKGGDLDGFSSLVWLLPDQKTGVFITYNANGDIRDDLYKAFMDRYFAGAKDTYGVTGFKPQPASELGKFEGIYKDLRVGLLLTHVKVAGDGTLAVKDAIGGKQTLKQVDELLFLDEKGVPMAFKLGADGQITYAKYNNFGSYMAKLPKPAGFADVPAGHPYAEPILALQSLGQWENGTSFDPAASVNRAEFVHAVMKRFNLSPSPNASIFADTAGNPYEAEIQGAAELGLVTGNSSKQFEPERAIKREEAAVIVSRLLELSGYKEPGDAAIKLAPDTGKWAVEAIRRTIKLGLHGPEVTTQNGVYQFEAKRALNRQELAALLYTLILA